MCSYIGIKAGYKPAVLYRILLEVLPFVLPIVPNFSIYLQSVILFSLPVLVFFLLDIFCGKYEPKTKRKQIKLCYYIPIIFLLFTIVILVSGIFKYHMIAIGSNSMYPVLEKGDAVIIEKLSKNELSLINEGDLLAFRWNNRITVHRIFSISFENGNYYIRTKGDANEDIDDYVVTNDNSIIGIIKFMIPLIGLPSVWLS